jgi:hypothetical protein
MEPLEVESWVEQHVGSWEVPRGVERWEEPEVESWEEERK